MKRPRKTSTVRWLLNASLLLACGSGFAGCGVSVTGLNFGSYNVFSIAPLRSVGSLSVTCNERHALLVTITLGPSANSGVTNPRALRKSGGTDVLRYNLFIDSAFSQIWGDGITGGGILSQRVTRNAPWNALVYGSLPALQNVSAGSYSDNLLVTIIW